MILSTNRVALVVVAAGRGARLGADTPKQYLPCAGKPLIAHTLAALTAAWPFSAIVVVTRAEDSGLYREALDASRPGRRRRDRAARDRRRDAPAERAGRPRGARRAERPTSC